MENMYEIFAREHPGLFTNCRDITALMEAAYGAWCFIAPPEKCNDKDFLDAFIDWEDMVGDATHIYYVAIAIFRREIDGKVVFSKEEWDYVINMFQDYYFNLGYAPIVDATDQREWHFLFWNPNFDKESTITAGYKTFLEFAQEMRDTIDNDPSVVNSYL